MHPVQRRDRLQCTSYSGPPVQPSAGAARAAVVTRSTPREMGPREDSKARPWWLPFVAALVVAFLGYAIATGATMLMASMAKVHGPASGATPGARAEIPQGLPS